MDLEESSEAWVKFSQVKNFVTISTYSLRKNFLENLIYLISNVNLMNIFHFLLIYFLLKIFL